jgi:ABC-type amino acid transport system permease subunit
VTSMHGMPSPLDSRAVPPVPTPREQKKNLLTLVVLVAVVHGVAIAVYHFAHIPDRPVRTQQLFVGVWVMVTLIVITPMMRRIRRGRRHFRRTPLN